MSLNHSGTPPVVQGGLGCEQKAQQHRGQYLCTALKAGRNARWESPTKSPFKAFRFLVEVESGGVVVAAFSQFSGVKMAVETVQARSGNDGRGVQEYRPGADQRSPLSR